MLSKDKLIVPAAFAIVCGCSLWLIFSSLHPPLPEIDEPPRLYSNQCQQDLRLLYVNAIKQAHHSIFLVMFGLSDPAILSALADVTKKRPTTIFYDAAESPQIQNKMNHADLHPVRLNGLMHQKILILDQDLVFIGSANMTSSSLLMHDNLVVGMRSQTVADFLLEKAPYSSGYIQTMVGGQETTTNLIGNGVLTLCSHPEELHRLRADLSLIPAAVEEMLRYEPPSQHTGRLAPADVELGGKTIRKRQAAIAVMAAGNRDPARFPEPDRFDITRRDNRHLSFGWAAHFCFGAALARIEGQVAFESMLRRMPDLALKPSKLNWRTNLGLRGLTSLPVTFSAKPTRVPNSAISPE